MKMKPLVIYHAHCADGFGAAFAAWLKFGDAAEYVPMQYGAEGWDYTCCTMREVYILDFSFQKVVMDSIFSVSNKVVWLDHHKTAFEMWCGGLDSDRVVDGVHRETMLEANYKDVKAEIILDNNKSGALIAWEYFHPDKEVPMLIKHIDDYDRWQFKIEGTKEFNKALWSYAPWSFEQWNNINLCVEENYHAVSSEVADKYEYGRLLLEGAAILRAHDANVQAVVKGAGRKCVLNLSDEPGFEPKGLTLYGLAANCPPHLASDVGHQLANQSGTYGLLWSLNREGKCLCSLRSNGDYDVSTIANAFGGGGHKNAAGFEVDIQTLLEWIK